MLKPWVRDKRLVIGSLLVFLWTGVAWIAHADGASAGEVRAVIKQARQSLQQARDLGYGWTVTPTFIEGAETELAAGQLDRAMTTAQRALLTADKAVEQARSEQTAWQARVPSLQ
jgi:hypothetical protein